MYDIFSSNFNYIRIRLAELMTYVSRAHNKSISSYGIVLMIDVDLRKCFNPCLVIYGDQWKRLHISGLKFYIRYTFNVVQRGKYDEVHCN